MANMSVAFSIRERNSQSGRARGLVALTDTPLARQLPEPAGRPADDQPLTAQEPPLARADACNRVREGSGASMASSFPVHREGRSNRSSFPVHREGRSVLAHEDQPTIATGSCSRLVQKYPRRAGARPALLPAGDAAVIAGGDSVCARITRGVRCEAARSLPTSSVGQLNQGSI